MDLNTMRFYEAQVAVVGSMLIDPRCAGVVFSQIREDDFRYNSLRAIYKAIKQLFAEGAPIDPVTVLNRAGREHEDMMRAAMAATPTANNVEAYCKILKDESDLARLKAMAEKVSSLDTAEEARKAVLDALPTAGGRNRWERLEVRDALNRLLDRLTDGTRPSFIKWGIPALDRNLQIKSDRGSFLILGAESSVGKTAFALQMAFSLAWQGKKVCFYSLETDDETAYDRVFVQKTKIKLRDLRDKRISAEEFARLSDLGESLYANKEMLYEIVDVKGGATVDEIRTDALIHRYDAVFIDYVQLLRERGENRAAMVASISMKLHIMAQELGILVVGLSQLTPPQDGGKRTRYRRNTMESLRESRQLIHDADVIMIMNRPDAERENYRELKIDKNKDGPLGYIQLDFQPEYMRFVPHGAEEKASRQEKRAAMPGQSTFHEVDDKEETPWGK